MKIIEALKHIKLNDTKIKDLQEKIGQYCAHLSHEPTMYGEKTAITVNGWVQSCEDLVKENIRLHIAIQKTNFTVLVAIKLGDDLVTKSIAEWILRRRTYAAIDLQTWKRLSDRGLQGGSLKSTQPGMEPTPVTIVYDFNPELRDKKVIIYKSESHLIDAALEIVNATTDLIEN